MFFHGLAKCDQYHQLFWFSQSAIILCGSVFSGLSTLMSLPWLFIALTPGYVLVPKTLMTNIVGPDWGQFMFTLYQIHLEADGGHLFRQVWTNVGKKLWSALTKPSNADVDTQLSYIHTGHSNRRLSDHCQ